MFVHVIHSKPDEEAIFLQLDIDAPSRKETYLGTVRADFLEKLLLLLRETALE